MAYNSTVDERYYGGLLQYSAGYLDAPSTLNEVTVLADGITGYGFLTDAYISGDIDIYSLGILNAGYYSVDVDGYSWDINEFGFGSVSNFQVLNSYGGIVYTSYSTFSDIEFTVPSSSTYYVKIEGPSIGTEQYSVEYTKTGNLQNTNSPAVFSGASITGDFVVGETLTANLTYFDSNGVLNANPITFWYADGEKITSGANTYILTANDAGKVITAWVGFYDDAGNLEYSDQFGPNTVVAAPNSSPTGSISIIGTTKDGNILTADTTNLEDTDGLGILMYQWNRDGTAIDKANSASYELIQDDIGSQITVIVNYTDLKGADESVTSNPTEVIFSSSNSILNAVEVSLIGDNVIDGLTHGYKWDLDSSRVVDWTISSGFNGEFWTSPQEVVDKATLALELFSSYADVSFNYLGNFDNPLVASANGSEINFSMDGSGLIFNNDNIWAIANFPSPDNGHSGDIYLNLNSQANYLSSYEIGSAGFFLILHELGHTLGLKHPHDDGGNARPTFAELDLGGLDEDFMTIMSYEDGYNWNLINWDPGTPMFLDVLALQYLYGKNETLFADDSEFSLVKNDLYATIWDPSGNDLIDQSAATEGWYVQMPDFEPSTVVDTKVGLAAPADELLLETPLNLYWLMGDFENINGSDFIDTIFGNSFDNLIRGNDGNDTLNGGSGNDTLTGGAGDDAFLFAGDFGHDVITDYNSDEDILEFYANDGSAVNISDLIETVNTDGDRVLSTADGLSSVTLEGTGSDVAIIEKTYTVTVGSAVTGSGNRYFIDGSEAPELILEPGHIYKFDLSHSSTSNHPFNLDVSELDFNLGITTTGSRGSDQIITVTVPDDASGAIDYLCTLHAGMGNTANFKFAQAITIDHTNSAANNALDEHQSLVFVSSETEHTTVAMSSGSLGTLSEDLSFTHVELSNSSYDRGISVSDVILQLRDIVGLSTLDGKHKIAADINGDGEIAINDVVSNLRHIVGLDTIKGCALVNSADEVVTSLTNSTIADLSIIQYGDVDLSATFLIAADNQAPTNITLSTDTISEEANTLVVGTLTTTDSDQAVGVKFTYSIAEVTGTDHTDFSINQTTGELSLNAQLDYETKSSYSVNILSTDEGGKTLSKSFTISITDENDAPTVANTIPDQTMMEDSTFSYQFASNVFADVDAGNIFTYSATLSNGSALPSWLKFDADTRTFSGTPEYSNIGTIDVKVTATDSVGLTISDTFKITTTNASNDAMIEYNLNVALSSGLESVINQDISTLEKKFSSFYNDPNTGILEILDTLDSETFGKKTSDYRVSSEGIFIKNTDDYVLSLEFSNFSPSSLVEVIALEESFLNTGDIKSLNISGGFEKIALTDPDGITMVELSHGADGIAWRNLKANSGEIDTFIVEGSFNNQIEDFIEVLSKLAVFEMTNIGPVFKGIDLEKVDAAVENSIFSNLSIPGFVAKSNEDELFSLRLSTSDVGEELIEISILGAYDLHQITLGTTGVNDFANGLLSATGNISRLIDVFGSSIAMEVSFANGDFFRQETELGETSQYSYFNGTHVASSNDVIYGMDPFFIDIPEYGNADIVTYYSGGVSVVKEVFDDRLSGFEAVNNFIASDDNAKQIFGLNYIYQYGGADVFTVGLNEIDWDKLEILEDIQGAQPLSFSNELTFTASIGDNNENITTILNEFGTSEFTLIGVEKNEFTETYEDNNSNFALTLEHYIDFSSINNDANSLFVLDFL